jgi:predicted nicotinamide N-methyase
MFNHIDKFMYKYCYCYGCRYILDNPAIFNGATVLDVGSGCGASAKACALCGADNVIANDVDPGVYI